MSSRSIRMAGMPARFSFIAGRIRERVDSIWPAAFDHNLGAPGPGSGGSGSTRQTVLKPDRESTSRTKLGLIKSDDEKADSLQSGFAEYNVDFGEDSRILALDAAEKPIGQTKWRRAES